VKACGCHAGENGTREKVKGQEAKFTCLAQGCGRMAGLKAKSQRLKAKTQNTELKTANNNLSHA